MQTFRKRRAGLSATAGLSCFTEQQSDSFIIGLTNVSPLISPPVPGQYAVCGQYPGAVPSGATVSLRCNDTDLEPARYVIVQLSITFHLGFCDLNVCASGIHQSNSGSFPLPHMTGVNTTNFRATHPGLPGASIPQQPRRYFPTSPIPLPSPFPLSLLFPLPCPSPFLPSPS